MKKVIGFFGHRTLLKSDIKERLKAEIEANIRGEVHCLIGTHGMFDELALSVCREMRKTHPQIKITVVLTSLNMLGRNQNEDFSLVDVYGDVETMFYEIEEEHFKRRITSTNRKMVEDCDLIICYVDMQRKKSGAKTAVKYAIKQGKEVVNIYQEKDRLSFEELKARIEEGWQRMCSKKK